MITTLHFDAGSGDYRRIPASCIPPRYPATVIAAYLVYRSRTLHQSHPDGRTDAGGRWYPTPDEQRDCCRRIRSPSRAWPWSLRGHCRSAIHCAACCGVEPGVLRGLISWLANYTRDTASAPVDLCLTCGASWPCEHREWWTPQTDDPCLIAVPDECADMAVHLGGNW
jgi:hypothetical protein